MSELLNIDKYDKPDEDLDEDHWRIMYTTFFLVAVFVFFWLLVVVFTSDVSGEVKEEEEEK